MRSIRRLYTVYTMKKYFLAFSGIRFEKVYFHVPGLCCLATLWRIFVCWHYVVWLSREEPLRVDILTLWRIIASWHSVFFGLKFCYLASYEESLWVGIPFFPSWHSVVWLPYMKNLCWLTFPFFWVDIVPSSDLIKNLYGLTFPFIDRIYRFRSIALSSVVFEGEILTY